MIRAAVEYAAKRGAPAVEAYPRAEGTRLHDDYAFTGTNAPEDRLRAGPGGAPGLAEEMGAARDHAPDDQEARRSRRSAGCVDPWSAASEGSHRVAGGRQETLTAPEHHPAVSSAVEASVRRYGETEPRLHAFTHFDAENSLLLDAALIATGATGALVRTPVGVKDIFDMAGAPTERGSALYAGRIAESDAIVVRNLRAAGAVIVGKTVTAELAMAHPGPTRNPWDLSRTSGGSSMGSAAAVAAGVVPLAVGSQTNGSVIRPAAFCGVVGFKPTFGRLSREGMFVTSETLDQVGGFARSVRDAASLVAAMAGEPLARWWSDDTSPPTLAALRTGEWEHADVAAQKRFQADVDHLAAAGGPIAWPSPPPGLDDAPAVLGTIMLFEEARAMERDIRGRETLVSAIARARLAEGAAISADTYREALRSRERLAEAFTSWATPYDAILTPATVGEAPTPETTGDPRFCTRWSLLGTPAIVIPSGLGPSRLPLGLQLVASFGDDRRLLAAAAWCEVTLPPIGAPAL
jgi:Asp-tRNA(Asn)/Glu-tRNA(Gln) amidotransferase A subunit family amidase